MVRLRIVNSDYPPEEGSGVKQMHGSLAHIVVILPVAPPSKPREEWHRWNNAILAYQSQIVSMIRSDADQSLRFLLFVEYNQSPTSNCVRDG